jgi:hypothetical protein
MALQSKVTADLAPIVILLYHDTVESSYAVISDYENICRLMGSST